jgi:hypothetical protein
LGLQTARLKRKGILMTTTQADNTFQVNTAVLATLEQVLRKLTDSPAEGIAILLYLAADISIETKNDDVSFEIARQCCVDNFNAAYAELLAQQEVKH